MTASSLEKASKERNNPMYDEMNVTSARDATADVVTTGSLEALQSAEQRELLDLVDNLRRTGLSSFLQLPQIVVCRDQSSGKSSVLEAITEIPFPQKENLCTRFATEISMRRGTEHRVNCKINPSEGRTEEEKQELRAFSKSIESFDILPSIIDEATALMGLGALKAFSKDVLCVEICGPDRPQLTLIDLPGLIHSSSRTQSDEDVELIKSLVKDYISKERTIILAVISAKNDYANQIILKMCRDFDEKGSRTLGIITKPDYLRPDSENEAAWLDLARNRDISFELGWHLLRNRADDERNLSFAQRNLKEQMFFSTGNYSSLPSYMMGVDALRQRLSRLLFNHLKRGLPHLRAELDATLIETSHALESLGKSRGSIGEQRIYLAELATLASNMIQMGLDGNYDTVFFGAIDVDKAVDTEENSLRLRAVVQHLNMRFAERIRTQGHAYSIEKEVDSNDDTSIGDAKAKPPRVSKKAAKISRQQAIERVILIQERIRGRELPGVFNPLIIGHLFSEQSVKWGPMAQEHIDAVAAACKAFVLHVLEHVARSEAKDKLYTMTVLPALKRAHAASNSELQRILDDKRRHPITYNHYFTDTLQKTQRDRYSRHLRKAAEGATVNVAQKTFMSGPGYEERQYIDPSSLESGFQRTIQPDMENFGAEQALDTHNAYYKDEQKYFIAVVTKQAVERQLVAPLASILSPKAVAGYSDEEVRLVAAEPLATIQLRAYLQKKKTVLENSQQAFQAAVSHDM